LFGLGPTGRAGPDGPSPTPVSIQLVLPGDPCRLLVLGRRRREPFSEDDLAVVRLEARQLTVGARPRLSRRRPSWTSQMEAVQKVAAQLTRLSSVGGISAALCTETRRVVAFDNARVYVLADDRTTLEPVAFRSHSPQYLGESTENLRVRVGEGITGWVAASGQPLVVSDAARDPRALDIPGATPVEEESMLLAPLRSEGQVIGVVVLSAVGLGRFDMEDLRLLAVLADQAAIAIENARLLAAKERLVAEQATLLDISQASGQAADERNLAGVLAGKLRAAAAMDGCTVYRWEEWSGHLAALAADPPTAAAPPLDALADAPARAVLTGGGPRFVTVADEEPWSGEAERLATLGASALLLLPLATAGRVIGLVELSSREVPMVSPVTHMDMLRTMANHAATALDNARLLQQLRTAAEVDLVSGVFSHRHLQERLRHETARATRTRTPLSLLMLDLDDFKQVNDEHGHGVGDELLRGVGAAIRGCCRPYDTPARFGGDEFAVVYTQAEGDGARLAAERVLAAVRRVKCAGGRAAKPVRASAGLVVTEGGGEPFAAAELVKRADEALYEAKRAGGDRLLLRAL
jgi:diguanylate cyclase (GGDEF)-like protein